VRSVSVALSIFVCAVLLGLHDVQAAPRATHSVLSGDLVQLRRLHLSAAKVNDRFPTIRLIAREVPGVGTAEFVFARRKLPPAQSLVMSNGQAVSDPIVPTLLQGRAFLRRSRGIASVVPASLAIIKDRITVQFTWARADSSESRGRSVLLKAKLGARETVSARAAMKPGASFAGRECGASEDTHVLSYRGARGVQPVRAKGMELYRIITLSTDADPEWYARYKETANAEIAATINAAEVMYQEQLGIRFAVVRQHLHTDTSPYISTDPSVLLASFRTNAQNPLNLGVNPATFDDDVDAKYLFSGKELDGSTVGLSYVGAMCWSPRNAYGLVQNVSRELNISVFAHEMGHTLGAQHDTSDRFGVMYPQVGIDRRYLSAVSLEQINRHFSWFGKCISEQLLRPSLAGSRLALRRSLSKDRRRLVINGSFVSAAGRPIVGELVKLTLNNKKVIVLPTDAAGLFKYSVRRSRFSGKILLVQAQAVSNETAPPEVLKIPLRA
jgi:hypothetical protein